MTLEQLTQVITSIARFHTTKITINQPLNGFVGNLGKTEYSMHITGCCAAVVDVLKTAGYNLSMDENGLNVDKYSK